MVRTRIRWVALAFVVSGLIVADSARAESTGGRSPLETPDAVRTVRVHLDGSVMLSRAAVSGIDFAARTRVPTGIEADAIVTDEDLAELQALGGRVVGGGERFRWSFLADRAPLGKSLSMAATLPVPPDPTVRVVRADYFTTKGQGFLYVEARTTQPGTSGITMRLENDTGPGTAMMFGRNMTRFDDSGVYMFHRNLFKVGPRPDQIRVTSSTGGVAIGKVSDWLRDVTPLTARSELQVELRRRLQAPAAALRPLRGDRPAVPGHRRDRDVGEEDERLPAQGAGDDRRHHQPRS